MGILELLTVVFVVLKLVGTIDWSWWLVLLPVLVSIGCYVIFIVGAIMAGATVTIKGFKRRKGRK